VGDAACTDVILCKFADLYIGLVMFASCVCLLSVCLFISVSIIVKNFTI